MAINRYTQPVQARYVPTTVDPNLQAAMLEKRNQEQAAIDTQTAGMESTLAGIKAYGDEDKQILQQKKIEYDKRLNDMYSKYGDNPNLMLNMMGNLNKDFALDSQSGDLARINSKYAQAQADIADAEERRSKKKLSNWAYQAQVQNAGSGWRATEDADMFKDFESQISGTNYADDVFNGDFSLAAENAINILQGQFQEELSYMSPDGRKQALETATAIVANKWRNDTGNDPYGKSGGKGTSATGYNTTIPGTNVDFVNNNDDIQTIMNTPLWHDYMNLELVRGDSQKTMDIAHNRALKRARMLMEEKYPDLVNLVTTELKTDLGREPNEKEIRKGLADVLTKQQARAASSESINSPSVKENMVSQLAVEGELVGFDKDGDEISINAKSQEGNYSSDLVEFLPFAGSIKLQHDGKDIFINADNPSVTPKAATLLNLGKAVYNNMYDFSSKGKTILVPDLVSGRVNELSSKTQGDGITESGFKGALMNGFTGADGNKFLYYLEPIKGTTEKNIYKVTMDAKGVVRKKIINEAQVAKDIADGVTQIYQYTNK